MTRLAQESCWLDVIALQLKPCNSWRLGNAVVVAMRWVLVLWFLVLSNALALAETTKTLKGVALVIGEEKYQHIAALTNPGNDARAIDKLLTDLGFEVDNITDADGKDLSTGLQRFVEDAEGADVALIYYSGHGIAAAGENYLVPIDADVASLEAADERLVPVSAIIAQLRAAVSLSIVLLDACRDSPFPPGARIKSKKLPEGAVIATSGLVATRGLNLVEPAAEIPAVVMGYAAEPGAAALDGKAGANSPYAAALLKHLPTPGFDFGDVMTMVAEEVYVETGGRQRPWANSSLRRFLNFGRAPEQTEGYAAAIRGERRHLLMTIATQPEDWKQMVAAIAGEAAVPLDALHAMLQALGQNAPADPALMERLVRAQTISLKSFLAERNALRSDDVEIARLSGLASGAMAEGAMNAAIRLHEQAKARVEELEPSVVRAEADMEAKRAEFAEVFARSARTHELAFNNRKAAEDYGRAFEQVEKWDAGIAWSYKNRQAVALKNHGLYHADRAALDEALAANEQALALAPRGKSPENWAASQFNRGNVLWIAGQNEAGNEKLELAVAAFRASLEVRNRDASKSDWAASQLNLGAALALLGQREAGTGRLTQALAVYDEVLRAISREHDASDWGSAQNSRGNVLGKLGERQNEIELLRASRNAYADALRVTRRKVAPIEWAAVQNNLGNSLQKLGIWTRDTAQLERSIAAFDKALQVWTPERAPFLRAAATFNLGVTLLELGKYQEGTAQTEAALGKFRDAEKTWTEAAAPLDWASVQHNIGIALGDIGQRSQNPDMVAQAVEAYLAALKYRSLAQTPVDWAVTQNALGTALAFLGEQRQDNDALHGAMAAFADALKVWAPETMANEWTEAQAGFANAALKWGYAVGDIEAVQQAAHSFRAMLGYWTRESAPQDWATTLTSLAGALMILGPELKDKALLEEARESFKQLKDFYNSQDTHDYDSYFDAQLVAAEQAIAAIP